METKRGTLDLNMNIFSPLIIYSICLMLLKTTKVNNPYRMRKINLKKKA